MAKLIVKRRKVPETIYHKETYCPTCMAWFPDNCFQFYPESSDPRMLYHSTCLTEIGIIPKGDD